MWLGEATKTVLPNQSRRKNKILLFVKLIIFNEKSTSLLRDTVIMRTRQAISIHSPLYENDLKIYQMFKYPLAAICPENK